MKRSVPAALFAAMLSACAVGPNYRPPAASTPLAFREAGVSEATTPDRWWEAYGDPTLVALIDRALAANGDVAIAETRIRQARARADEARGGRLPELNAQGSTTLRRLSRNGEQLANIPTNLIQPDLDYTVYRAGFDASWELDLVGRNRRQVEAAEARVSSAVETRNDTLVRVAGDVASAYADYRAAEQRIHVANQTLAAAHQTADLTGRLVRAGEEAQSELERVESIAEESAAALPPLNADAKSALYRLDVLLGAQPGSAEAVVAGAPAVALRAPDVAAGLPSDLLRRRPDIRRAERELAAATADIGVATADLYPRFSLTGTLGLEALSIGSLVESASRYGSLVPGFSLPIFDGGRRRAGVRRQQALLDESLATYNQTITRALADVETALLRYRESRARVASLQVARTRLGRALDLARLRYRAGEASLTEMLDVQRQVSALDDRLAQAEAASITSAISAQKALGGGWQSAAASTSAHPGAPTPISER